jgi:hypothetical protein
MIEKKNNNKKNNKAIIIAGRAALAAKVSKYLNLLECNFPVFISQKGDGEILHLVISLDVFSPSVEKFDIFTRNPK